MALEGNIKFTLLDGKYGYPDINKLKKYENKKCKFTRVEFNPPIDFDVRVHVKHYVEYNSCDDDYNRYSDKFIIRKNSLFRELGPNFSRRNADSFMFILDSTLNAHIFYIEKYVHNEVPVGKFAPKQEINVIFEYVDAKDDESELIKKEADIIEYFDNLESEYMVLKNSIDKFKKRLGFLTTMIDINSDELKN